MQQLLQSMVQHIAYGIQRINSLGCRPEKGRRRGNILVVIKEVVVDQGLICFCRLQILRPLAHQCIFDLLVGIARNSQIFLKLFIEVVNTGLVYLKLDFLCQVDHTIRGRRGSLGAGLPHLFCQGGQLSLQAQHNVITVEIWI